MSLTAMGSFLAFISVLNFTLALIQLCQFFYYGYQVRKYKVKWTFNDVQKTLIALFLATIFNAIAVGISVYRKFGPVNGTTPSTLNSSKKERTQEIFLVVCSAFFLVFLVMGMLNIGIVWYDVALRSKKLSTSNKRLNRLRQFIVLDEIFLIVILIVAHATRIFLMMFITFIAQLTVLVFVFLLGAFKLVSTTSPIVDQAKASVMDEGLKKRSEMLERLQRRVISTAIQVSCVGITGIGFVLAGVFVSADSYQANLPFTSIGNLLGNLWYLLFIITIQIMANYVFSTLHGSIEKAIASSDTLNNTFTNRSAQSIKPLQMVEGDGKPRASGDLTIVPIANNATPQESQ